MLAGNSLNIKGNDTSSRYLKHGNNPAGINLLKANSKTRCEICQKLTIKTPERRHSGVFVVNFEYISHHVLVFLLLTLNM